MIVHFDTCLVEGDSGGLEVEAFDIGGAADCDQDLVCDHRLFPAFTFELECLRVIPPLGSPDTGSKLDVNSFSLELRREDGGGIWVLARQEARTIAYDRDVAAESAEGLSELAANRAGPNDDEAAWEPGQREHALIGEEARLRKPANRGTRGPGSCCDHRAREVQPLPTDLNGIASDEPCLPQENVDTELRQAMCRVVVRDAGTEAAHPLRGCGEVEADGIGRTDAERGCLANCLYCVSCSQQAFGRHAAEVETVSAHQVLLDERDLGAESGRAHGRDEPRGACAQDD